jgi:hypothetical protein
VVDARLHKADVVTHDEQDVRLRRGSRLSLRLRRADEPRHGGQQQPGGDPAEQPREICASSSGTSSLMV